MNHYQTLGLERSATKKEITKAYRELALLHHPDKNPQDKKGATDKFQKINNAYDVLDDDQQKTNYDVYLDTQKKESFSNAQWKAPEISMEFIQMLAARAKAMQEKPAQTWKEIKANSEKKLKRKRLGAQLAEAAMNGKWDQVEKLHREGAYLDELSPEGYTPMVYAICQKNDKAVIWLLNCGANVNKKDQHGNTPLHHAVLIDDLELCKILMKNQNIENHHKNQDGYTALHIQNQEHLYVEEHKNKSRCLIM